MKPSRTTGEPEAAEGSLLSLACLSLLVGIAAGSIGACFRAALDLAEHIRNDLLAWAHPAQLGGFLIVVGVCSAATAAAAWLVHHFAPLASGSGIPHAESVLRGEVPQAPYRLIPVKFIGGVLSIGSGLALGREGPTVQMGATTAHFLGKAFRRSWPDCRALLAAGAGAGLATAFNAPIAGAIFVLEELVRKFETRMTIAALGASTTAIAVARLMLGDRPDFQMEPLPPVDIPLLPLFLVLGGMSGLLAIAYNGAILGGLAAAMRLNRCPVEARAAIVGGGVGVLAWFLPDLVGGGDLITQRTLAGGSPLALLPFAFLLRFALGTVSYAAQTPGGLFAPLLVLGAQSGLLFGYGSAALFPHLGVRPETFAVAGMAALFAGVVRSPMTGIVLVGEMTSSFAVFLPMLGACFAAMTVPTLWGSAPLYDSLRQLTPRPGQRRSETQARG